MERGEMMRAARNGRDPDFLEASRLFKEAVLESKKLAELVQANYSRMKNASRRAHRAAGSYVASLKDEISVAPACKCQCEGEQ
jgi:hypothetical protein